ncbi:MAG: rod shape-determining protein RodA [Ruminococcaceae bacterium]|nr:rod shape-determining protein RodA [Oscillospiraceae bacterium]
MESLRKNLAKFIKGTDWIMMLLCLLASSFGALLVHSATLYTLTEDQVISRDTRTMLIAVALGITVAIIISLIDYELIIKIWPVIAAVALLLMVSLFFFGVGPDARSDAKTWLKITSSFYLQPSEFVKIAFVVTFGVHIELISDKIDKVANVLLLTAHAMIYAGLVALTGDIGSALVFVFIFVGMMFVANVKLRYFAIGLLAVIAMIPIVWTKVFSEIQKERFLALFFPESYGDVIYQQDNCIKAIGSGGLFGKGLFNGTFTQNGIVPESKNDMILSVIGEELGFIGCLGLLVLFAVIVIKIINNGRRSKDNTGTLVCYGIAFMILSQIVINIGMCLQLLPVIGITLPFMSAGGSSTLSIYVAMGLIMSVYRQNIETDPENFIVSGIVTPYSNYKTK